MHRITADLPYEKAGKALSYISFLVQEPEIELTLTDAEYSEFIDRLSSLDFVTDEELSAKIEALPDGFDFSVKECCWWSMEACNFL